MEYYAGANKPLETNKVLILIIMEDTHGDGRKHGFNWIQTLRVLILIIMEDTHGED